MAEQEMNKDTEFRSAEIVQSTEHSIVETFVRPGSENKHWERERCPTCSGGVFESTPEDSKGLLADRIPCPDCREDPGFVKIAVPREPDLEGNLKIVIKHPTADTLQLYINDFQPAGHFGAGFLISVEGAAALQTSLMRMLNFRQMHVNEAKMPAGTPPDSKPLVHPADRER